MKNEIVSAIGTRPATLSIPDRKANPDESRNYRVRDLQEQRLMTDTPTLIKPFTATVGQDGIAIVQVGQNIHGLTWVVYQIGFGLGIQAASPQVAAHLQGQPLVASAPMQVSAFAQIPTQSPYAMESFFYGPPYVSLEAGENITCAVIAATPGDTFTVAAYVNEMTSLANAAAMNAKNQYAAAYIPRAGTRTWR
jgi:hypothetical protein